MTINVLCLFLMVPWVGLQCVIVAFPSHIHLLFEADCVDALAVWQKCHLVGLIIRQVIEKRQSCYQDLTFTELDNISANHVTSILFYIRYHI